MKVLYDVMIYFMFEDNRGWMTFLNFEVFDAPAQNTNSVAFFFHPNPNPILNI